MNDIKTEVNAELAFEYSTITLVSFITSFLVALINGSKSLSTKGALFGMLGYLAYFIIDLIMTKQKKY